MHFCLFFEHPFSANDVTLGVGLYVCSTYGRHVFKNNFEVSYFSLGTHSYYYLIINYKMWPTFTKLLICCLLLVSEVELRDLKYGISK